MTAYWGVAFAPMGSGRLGTSLCWPSPVHNEQANFSTVFDSVKTHQAAQTVAEPCFQTDTYGGQRQRLTVHHGLICEGSKNCLERVCSPSERVRDARGRS